MWDPRDVIWYKCHKKTYRKLQLFHYSFIWSRVKPVQVVHTLEYFQRELSLSSDYMRNCSTCTSLTSSYKIFGKVLAGPDPVHCFCSFSFPLETKQASSLFFSFGEVSTLEREQTRWTSVSQ